MKARILPLLLAAAIVSHAQAASLAAPLEIQLPLGRSAYQTNESIDLAVVRTATEALPATELVLTLAGEDGSRLKFAFPTPAVALENGAARRTDHLHLDGRLLRPGRYAVQVTAGSASAETQIELHSHLRRSSFKIIQWGSRAKGPEQALLGEQSVGFNLVLPAYGGLAPDELIRAGVDYMWCCTMGGGHQLDLRQECDWSDPYVLGGAVARGVRRAMEDRTRPNAIGVHLFDEPGLTWWKHSATGVMVPFNLPSQDRAFAAAFGRPSLQYNQVKPDDAGSVAQWRELGRWKQSFMEAAWKQAAFGIYRVRPDFLPVTQSVYAAYAYSDGYYFNIVRPLPVASGHGGYDDWGPCYFHPSFVFELGRMRDLAKPNWYLPCWYQSTPGDRFRMEQYLAFMGNLQGMAVPPDMTVQQPGSIPLAAEGIVESNKLMARLGTIFTTMPVTRGQAAVLYSLAQNLDAQIHVMATDVNRSAYEGGGHARDASGLVHVAGKMIQTQIDPIVEEDILDGTLAAHYKAVVLPGIHYLDPPVVAALEAYAAAGGTVLLSDDSRVEIKGAAKLGAPATSEFLQKLARLWLERDQPGKLAEREKLYTAGNYMAAAAPLAKAMRAQFDKLGIRPALECDSQSVAAARQAAGDIEYLFAVNVTYDPAEGKMNSIKATEATLAVPDDGRPVYDAVLGGPAELKPQGKNLAGRFRFGPGQMRVFARTAKAIGGIRAATPIVARDFTTKEPIAVQVSATLLDAAGRVLAGSVPLEIRLVDPLGATRYQLDRATAQGTFAIRLPLAANDPPGQWTLVVRELLANTEDTVAFDYAPAAQCGALAGATPRAVSFGEDRENVFRFFRTYQDVTIVKGAGDYNGAAAERLAATLKPWGVRATIVAAAEVNKPRTITDEEARTWVGLDFGRVSPKDARPGNVGFAVRGPVVLLGTPEDNPLIKFALDNNFLPYKPGVAFPGRGRGMLAWQRDAVGYGQESIALVAYGPFQ
ncbi:MAG: hypothetical protein ACYC35_29205 [Pirellulales bacterium]